MGRLVSVALYSNESINLHYVKDCIAGGNPQGDLTDYNGIEERAMERINIVDPNGEKSSALLREQLEKRFKTTNLKVDSHNKK